jgi:biotin carboxyl carrier protein
MIQRYSVEIGGKEEDISVEALGDGRVRLCRGGRESILSVRRLAFGEHGAASTWSVAAAGGGVAQIVDVEGRAPDLSLTLANVTVPVKIFDPLARAAARGAGAAARRGGQSVSSPMPGKVVRVLVKTKDLVKAGQGVAVVEAMKMENELKAPRDGQVLEVRAKEGQAVEAGETLVTLE